MELLKHMLKKSTLIILYISTWVIIWVTIGSIIDYPLLQSDIYKAGSIFQYLTFFLTFLLSLVLAISLYPNIVKRLIK